MELLTGADPLLGGWSFLGYEFSTTPEPGCEVDPAIVDAIRGEFDPDFVPLWVSMTYRSPGGATVRRGFHAICRHVRHPERLAGWGAEPIQGLTRPATGWRDDYNVNQIYGCYTLMGPLPLDGSPPKYRAFDRRVYLDMKRDYYLVHGQEDGVKKVVDDLANGPVLQREKNIEAIQENARLLNRDNKRQILKAVEKDLAGEAPPQPPGPKVSIQVPAGSTPVKES